MCLCFEAHTLLLLYKTSVQAKHRSPKTVIKITYRNAHAVAKKTVMVGRAVIPAPGRWRPENWQFEVILTYTVSLRPTWGT